MHGLFMEKKTSDRRFIQIINTMLKYQRDRLKSRHKSPTDIIHCEIPDCPNVATEIHHISRSMRGKRKNKDDGSDLIALCRPCHEKIHAQNTEKNIKNLLEIVQKILKRKKMFFIS